MEDITNITNLVNNSGKYLQRLGKLSQNGFGQRVFGKLSQPLLVNLHEIEQQKIREEDDDFKDQKKAKVGFEKFQETLKNNFAWGDLFTLVGAGLLGIQNKIFPSRNPKPSFLDRTFRTIAMLLTFGGSTSALYGRMMDMHKREALGDDYADAKLMSAEKKGKKIFKEFSSNDIQKLIKKANKLDKVLIYKPGLKESILERYAKDDIGGLLDGPPGTGKTDGVHCILGKWAQRLKQEEQEPVIAELNLAEFDDYLKETQQQRAELMQAVQIGFGLEPSPQASLTSGEGLQILELLVRRIQKLVNKTKRHNQNNPAKAQKLAVFVDEFDKIFDPRTLKGCDKQRLKNLLLQFNDLFVKTNILITSNKTLEEMIDQIKEHLRDEEGNDAREVWEPMYSRISSKNRALVEKPAAAEQAEIIASRMLSNHFDYIDWKDFPIDEKGKANTEQARKIIAKPIQTIIEKHDLQLDGRQLSYAADDLTSMLLGRARELKAEKNISDEDWNKASTEEKIKLSGALIDKKMLETTLENKADSNKIEKYHAQKAEEEAKAKNKNKSILKSGVKAAREVLNILSGQSNTDPDTIERNLTNIIEDIDLDTAPAEIKALKQMFSRPKQAIEEERKPSIVSISPEIIKANENDSQAIPDKDSENLKNPQ